MKKVCIILAIVLSFSIILSACGSNSVIDTPPAQTSAPSNPPAQTGNNNEDGSEKTESAEDVKTAPEDDWIYYYNGNGVTIYEYTGSDINVTIPTTLEINGVDKKVTEIAGRQGVGFGFGHRPVFGESRGEIESVVIPDGVTSIGDYAFEGMSALKSVTIPDSVISVGEIVFPEAWIKNQPAGPLYLGKQLYGFVGGQPVGDFVIKDGTTEIRSRAFAESVNLTSVTIPNSVTSIGAGAFYNCTGLTSIEIPNSVTTIDKEAFYNCTNLTVAVPENLTTLGDYAFNGVNVLYPDGPLYEGNTITNSIIQNDRSKPLPKEIVIKDGTTTMPNEYLYYFFDSSYSVTMPESLVYIAKCGSVNWDITYRYIPDGPVYADKIFCTYKGDMPANTSFEIREGTLSIAEYAFSGLQTLTSVTIPDGLTTIGDYAFVECAGLTSVTIPDSVTTIGKFAFNGCKGLTSISIPGSLTRIGDYAFYECSGITGSVAIPDGVTFIGERAFEGCKLTSVTIPYSVTFIGDYAFQNVSDNFTISAPVGSYAQIYAIANNIPFTEQ